MKPDWKDAPEWANWLFKDHGEWYWAEHNQVGYDGDVYVGKFEFIKKYTVGVSEFPEERPA